MPLELIIQALIGAAVGLVSFVGVMTTTGAVGVLAKLVRIPE